jgi:hypothetical protein
MHTVHPLMKCSERPDQSRNEVPSLGAPSQSQIQDINYSTDVQVRVIYATPTRFHTGHP